MRSILQQRTLNSINRRKGLIVTPSNIRNFCRSSYSQQQQRQQYHSEVKVTKSRGNELQFEDDHYDATSLVDNLVQYTETLMKQNNKENNLQQQHVVAFSGGVDSSLVLALLQKAASGDQKRNQIVQPVLGISPAVSSEQIELARKVSSTLQIPLKEVRTTEGGDDTYIKNAGEACFACKTHLYTSLQLVLDHASAQQQSNNQTEEEQQNYNNDEYKGSLYNGTNADDVKDPTRLGLIAAANFRVLSPLEYTTKADVRRAAKHLGLPNWNYAASPCLRSRLALGVQATQQHLRMIEKAESLVKETLPLKEYTNMRVRLLSKQRARVEIDDEFVDDAINHGIPTWNESFKKLGFSNVEVKVFKSGSVAVRKDKVKKLITESSSSMSSSSSSLAAA